MNEIDIFIWGFFVGFAIGVFAGVRWKGDNGGNVKT